jgi:hypothetical protein
LYARNKSEKAIRSSSNNEATTGIIIEDTTLSKIGKTDAEWKKSVN